MSKNLQSPTKLTEFAPLQPEEKQQGVTQFISKLFKLNRPINNTHNTEHVNVLENGNEKLLQESLPAWAIETSSDNEASQGESPYSIDLGEGRSLPNVLKRITSLLKTSNLQAYSESERKQYWMPDDKSKECYECCEKFTTFRRRHHCRVCGQIFCAQCCNGQIPGKLFRCTGYLRGCTYCCNVVLSYLKSLGIGSELNVYLKVLQDSLENKYGAQSEYCPSVVQASLSPVSCASDINEGGSTLKRKVSVGYQEEKFAPGSSSVNYITIEERCRALQNSVSLRNLYEEICKPTTGIILRSHKYRLRTHLDCFLGSELVDWLIRQQKANTRIQAAAICQALLEGGYIECVSDPCSFVDGYALYKPGTVTSLQPLQNLSENSSQDEPTWAQFVSQENNLTDSENEPLSPHFGMSSGRLTSSSSFTLNLNVGAVTVYLSKPIPSSHSISSPDDGEISETQRISSMETSVIRTSEQRENVPESGWHNPSQLREENGEKNAYNLLQEAFQQHESSLVKQLLNQHNLQLSWSDTLLPLIHEIVDCVHPDLHHNAEIIDIRQYVKFKKLPGGVRSDCKLIQGIAFTKNIAHKAMPNKTENPKILLLLGSIVYQRIEGRLMSLEPVLMQEHESLRNIATRITKLKPDIVLVERNVARVAQDILREKGVTLVLNVKQRILDILSKCTQATLVASVDSHIGTPTLGSCKHFYLKSYKNDIGETKTLMFFDKVPQSHLCGTVLLRGASYSELVKVKKVASLLLFACYNWRLEKSFLMDEFAQPPNARDEFFDDSREGSPTSAKPHSSIIDQSNDLLKNRKISKTSQISNMNIFDENENDTEVFINTEDIGPKNATLNNSEEKKAVSKIVTNYTDPLHSYNKEDEVVIRKSEKLSVADLPFSNHFRKHLDDTILCISPFLVFSVPYLETENGRKCKLRSFFPEQIYYSEQFLSMKRKTNRVSEENNNQVMVPKPKLKPPHPFTTARITANADNNEIQTLLAHFRACGGRLEKKATLAIVNKDADEYLRKKLRGDFELDHVDVLDPNNHQRLAVLFCSYSDKSNNAPAFCVYPWIVHMGFYGSNDIPLGCFLERYCFRSSYTCQSDTCGTPMLNHTRRFVHNSGCVSISLKHTKHTEDKIIMWSWCSRCQICSPSVQMSRDTWSFSFAKYLELKFHGSLYTKRGNINCSHNLHHDNIHYFSYNNIVAEFEYSHIQLWEISLPPPIIRINYDKVRDHSDMIEEIKTMALKGHEIFSTISEKLAVLPPDFDGLSNLKQILSKEQSAFKQKVEEVQLKLTSPSLETAPDDFSETSLEPPVAVWRIADALVRVKRLIAEAVEQWNMRLSESFKKKDIDKKKDRTSHTDLDSPITPDSRSLNNQTGDSEIKNPNAETTPNTFTKKIRSLDHSDVNVSRFYSQPHSLLDNASDETRLTTIFSEDPNYGLVHVDTISHKSDRNDHTDVHLNAAVINRVNSYNNLIDKDYTPPSPKCHHRSQSDGTVLSQYDDLQDNKKDIDKKIVKTIFSQLLPSSSTSIPIAPPFNIQEHYTLPTGVYFPVIVFESEPSSVIAYALNSFDYKRALEDLAYKKTASNEQTPSPIHKRYSQVDKERADNCETASAEKSTGLLSFLRTKDIKSELTNSINASIEVNQSVGSEQSGNNDKLDEPKRNKTSNIEIQFEDSNCKFFCRIYFADKFAALRSMVLPIGEEAYVRSLSRSVPWNARGGKSGSTFCKTTDDRFILKEMPKSEIQLFLEFAPKYFAYMNRCHDTAQPTLLGKIVGIYQIVFKNNTTNATLRTHLLVMENLFYERTVTQKFDLKGSMRNRLVNPDNQDGEIVLLDENLLKMSCDSPLYILPHSKTVLTAAIQNDTEFLSAQSVMDYSLLVGLDSESKELVVGIIDYIRTFTWDKKLETMVKKSGMLWGQGKLPTIVSPKEYCKRFIEAMHRYFLEVPDPWTGLGKGLEC